MATLPPLVAAWSGASPERRKDGPPTAAEILGVGKSTVWKMIREGKLETVRLSPGITRIKTASLYQLIDKKPADTAIEAAIT